MWNLSRIRAFAIPLCNPNNFASGWVIGLKWVEMTAVRLHCNQKWVYKGIASWLSLWLAIAYLWIAIFHPETCAPYSAHHYYAVSTTQPTETLSVDPGLISKRPLLAAKQVAMGHIAPGQFPPVDALIVSFDQAVEYGNYISAEASTNAAWLLRAHNHADAGFTLISFMILALPQLIWLQWLPPFSSLILLQPQLHHQCLLAPPVGPPRFQSVVLEFA